MQQVCGAGKLLLRRRAGKQSVCEGLRQMFPNVNTIPSGVEVFFYDGIQFQNGDTEYELAMDCLMADGDHRASLRLGVQGAMP